MLQNGVCIMKHVRTLLFAEGLVSVSLQFLFMRHLMPNVGSSVIVSSIVISMFLFFLSLGYYVGGEQKKKLMDRLSWNFLYSAILLAAGLSPAFPRIYFSLLQEHIHINLLLAGYLLVFMAPAVYWLGQTMPLLANAVEAETKGKVSATVLFYSTMGNVVGSLFSVLILMRYAGMGVTTFANIAVLALLYAWVSTEGQMRWIRVAGVTAMAFVSTVVMERHYFDFTNQYSNYLIYHDNGSSQVFEDKSKNGRFLMANSLNMSAMNDAGDGFSYVDMIRREIRTSSSQPADVLVLGAGGFTISYLNDKNRYTFVDVDGQLKDYAERSFLKTQMRGNFVIQDARQYLITNNKKWDVVVLDTYASTFSVPWHLATQEYFQLVKTNTKPNGLVLINAIMRKQFGDQYSRRLNHTINSVFKDCSINDMNVTNPIEFEGAKYTNVVYSCRIYADETEIFEDRKIREF